MLEAMIWISGAGIGAGTMMVFAALDDIRKEKA